MASATPADEPAGAWLSADERRTWLAWVFATRLFWDEIEHDLQRDSGMSFADYDVLVMLSEAPGRRLRMHELADATRSSRSRLTHAVARLEERGWVRRERCETDRRGAEAVLTDAGFAALAAAAPAHVASVRRHLFSVLTPDQQHGLADVAGRLLAHLTPLAEGRGGTRPAQLARAVATRLQ